MKRRAFVVGINEYPQGRSLHGAVEDAARMARKLVKCEFDVTLLQDTTLNALLAELSAKEVEWEEDAKDSLLFFYYSGHGTLANGVAHMDVPHKEGSKQLNVQEFVEQRLLGHAAVSVCILDMCLTGEGAGGQQLTRGALGPVPGGDAYMLRCYATSPGQTAAEGLGDDGAYQGIYTQKLLQELFQPGKHLIPAMEAAMVAVRDATKRQQNPELSWMAGALAAFNFPLVPELEVVVEQQQEISHYLGWLRGDDECRQQVAADELWPRTWGPHGAANMAYMVAHNVVNTLKDIVCGTTAPSRLHKKCCNIMQNLACNEIYREQLATSGALKGAVQVMCNARDEPAFGAASGALLNLCSALDVVGSTTITQCIDLVTESLASPGRHEWKEALHVKRELDLLSNLLGSLRRLRVEPSMRLKQRLPRVLAGVKEWGGATQEVKEGVAAVDGKWHLLLWTAARPSAGSTAACNTQAPTPETASSSAGH